MDWTGKKHIVKLTIAIKALQSQMTGIALYRAELTELKLQLEGVQKLRDSALCSLQSIEGL